MSQHTGWDGRYSHPEAGADSGQQWRTQLANLHEQWPEMAKQVRVATQIYLEISLTVP